MSNKNIINTIFRRSINITLINGKPPEKALRMALVELFLVMARAVEHYEGDTNQSSYFPVNFPMRLTLKSNDLIWDLELQMKLENNLSILASDGKITSNAAKFLLENLPDPNMDKPNEWDFKLFNARYQLELIRDAAEIVRDSEK